MNKKARAELRRDMDRVLENLDSRWISAASRELCQNLLTLFHSIPPERIDHVLAWISHFTGEVDLSGLIDDQLDMRNVYLPRVIGPGEMEFVRAYKGWEESFVRGYKDIPGPPPAAALDVFQASMAEKTIIIVPGVAFDKLGNWVGRSFGYYNKFLSNYQMRGAVKIGVCWSLQMIEQAPADPYDIFLDYVCTEEGLISTEPHVAGEGERVV